MKNILVIGLGRFGRFMSKKLIEEGNDVLAVDADEYKATTALKYCRNVQIGDAANEEFIESLGVNNFDICVVAIGDNFQSALEITVLLKDYGAKFIIVRASRDVHKKLLLRNGADYVVYSERETAERLAVKFGAQNVFDYVELTDDYAIYEITTPTMWIGKSILQAAVRSKYNVNILATKNERGMLPMPSPEYVFTQRDTLLVMGHADDIIPLTRKKY